MKSQVLISTVVACLLSAPMVSAQGMRGMGMDKPMNMDKPMSQAQENMKGMQAQMDRIEQTTDPKERRRLMKEHMQALQENIKAMPNMSGSTMSNDPKDGDMKKRQEMTENRMDMMQMMMEQMMKRDQVKDSMPAMPHM